MQGFIPVFWEWGLRLEEIFSINSGVSCLNWEFSMMHRKSPGMGYKKVQVGKDQEKAQSEKDSHSKNRGGKKPNEQSGTYTIKTFRKPNEQLFSQ